MDTNWSDLDYLLVDLPPGTGDIPLTLAQTIPITGILVVTTPQEVASSVAVKAIGMFEKLNVPMLGIIENMSDFLCTNCNTDTKYLDLVELERISEKHQTAVPWTIPLTPEIMSVSDSGKPSLLSDPQSPSSKAFVDAAKNVAAQCSILAAKLQETAKEPPSEEQDHFRIRRIDEW